MFVHSLQVALQRLHTSPVNIANISDLYNVDVDHQHIFKRLKCTHVPKIPLTELVLHKPHIPALHIFICSQ